MTLRAAAGFAVITPELGRLCEGYRRPVWVSGNGITLTDHALGPAPHNPTPRAVFVGAARPYWRGIDEIMALAARLADWRFDIVGYRLDDVTGAVPGNVHLHGPLPREHFAPIVRQADVALGPVSLYRNDMDEACPLKVREYLAYGVPVVSAYHDPDLADPPFVLQLPNTPGNLVANLPRIVEFVESWRGRRVAREDIRYLDMAYKEAERLRFFESILRVAGPISSEGGTASNPAISL